MRIAILAILALMLADCGKQPTGNPGVVNGTYCSALPTSSVSSCCSGHGGPSLNPYGTQNGQEYFYNQSTGDILCGDDSNSSDCKAPASLPLSC